jgi:uncharacterized paraquat-inducible protein A
MSYEVIEKNEYGVLVKKMKSIPTECEKCKYTGRAVTLQPCKSCKTDNSYYLTDQEAAKLETETDSQKELIALQIENKQLKERIETFENNTTELIPRSGNLTHDYWYYCQECLQDLETDNHNFCPNCGRKIIKN